ncbi:hypothetical protein BD779DRAFT_1033663 [Infundibulicybe gibba]|nr:hypothetical protein BD779DRAFT_1033663 [Infundibulicybe gibba]
MEDLPIEIMHKIFLELCSPRTTFPLRRDEPRLSITHTCSRWRAIALSTPTLWADFYICSHWVESALYPDAIRAWISRAAQFTLSFKSRIPATYLEMFPAIDKVVFPAIHRCSSLNLHLNIATMHRLLTLPPYSLYALQSLTILIRDQALVVDPTPFATAFKSCPQLWIFELTTYGYPPEYQPEYLRLANFNIPWHQLAVLKLDSPSIPAD